MSLVPRNFPLNTEIISSALNGGVRNGVSPAIEQLFFPFSCSPGQGERMHVQTFFFLVAEMEERFSKPFFPRCAEQKFRPLLKAVGDAPFVWEEEGGL